MFKGLILAVGDMYIEFKVYDSLAAFLTYYALQNLTESELTDLVEMLEKMEEEK